MASIDKKYAKSSSHSFPSSVQSVHQKCANVVRDIFEPSEKKVGYRWILGKKLASGDSLEFEKLIEKLHPVILSDIQSAVGDAPFTSEELKERCVAALKGEQHGTTLEDPSILDDGSLVVKRDYRNDAQMGDLMQVLEEVHNQDLTDGQYIGNSDGEWRWNTKVRRTRYALFKLLTFVQFNILNIIFICNLYLCLYYQYIITLYMLNIIHR